MRIWSTILGVLFVLGSLACGPSKPVMPKKTFETYVRASQKKDTAAMKTLLSTQTLAMHEQEAKAQGITLDELLTRESTVAETQRTIEYRDERIDGDKATLQVRSSSGWETWPFVRENGDWKIDKAGMADQIEREIEEQNRQIDALINGASTPAF